MSPTSDSSPSTASSVVSSSSEAISPVDSVVSGDGLDGSTSIDSGTPRPFRFELRHTDPTGARLGRLITRRGEVETPAFMPVGTAATVKTLTPREVLETGSQIILGNTYHLMLRPGHERIARLGGLHHFMNWSGPILTDSGGFQVFSLGALRTLSEEGVAFRSHIDGSAFFLSPEGAIKAQEDLGSDIMMQLDECPPYPAEKDYLARSMALSLRWARRSKEARNPDGSSGALFGIVQGGMNLDLRAESAEGLMDIGFDGYALGGLSVGEPPALRQQVLDHTPQRLPPDHPRYLMGVGKPQDLVAAVGAGVDMFDCVLPTRNARNGQLFTWNGTLNIKGARFREDQEPVAEGCGCECCRHYSRAYLHHLFRSREILGLRLMTLHNLHFYQELMAGMRQAISENGFEGFRKEFAARLAAGG
ncbi:MAG: tRNA guanosine(34) transglycosylase Tgt [Magnetococcales bacterium]|nr:tRNA guanosine(34) transglycosylase Tgt [Magnetococcales bacterium]